MSVLIFSGHDYRSPRRAHMHFIADALSKRMKVRFASIGFSAVSWWKSDARMSLWSRANRVETVDGVDCYLWRTVFHPFNLRTAQGEAASRRFFSLYTDHAPDLFWRWAREAKIVIFESGLSPIFIKKVRTLNPNACLLYLAADDLETIGCSRNVITSLHTSATDLDAIVVPSLALASHMPSGVAIHHVPYGLDESIGELIGQSPYGKGQHAVSIGSMLFDPVFFARASEEFPELTFHVIGAGPSASRLRRGNIIIYPEMPFHQMIPYVAHATFGIAAYDGRFVAPYLADTSLKLMQYRFFGLPAVCPDMTAANRSGRHGYNPRDLGSIASAIASALSQPRPAPARFIPWSQVVDQILAVASKVTQRPSCNSAFSLSSIGQEFR